METLNHKLLAGLGALFIGLAGLGACSSNDDEGDDGPPIIGQGGGSNNTGGASGSTGGNAGSGNAAGTGGSAGDAGGGSGGSGGDVACTEPPGANGCGNCPPTNDPEFFNHCTTATCAAFDNATRLPLLVNGQLPPLP